MCSFWLGESCVAIITIKGFVPSLSRYETRQCGILCAVRVISCRDKQWRHTYKKRILSGAKEDEGGSSREELTLIQGRTTVGILMGMTKLNLTVSRW